MRGKNEVQGKTRANYEKLAQDLDNLNDDLLSRSAAQAIRDLCLMVWGKPQKLFEDVETKGKT